MGCLVAALGIVGVWWSRRDWAAYHRGAHPFDSLQAELRPLPEEDSPFHRAFDLVLTCSRGYRTLGRFHLPRRSGPHRAVLLVGGLGTGRAAARLVPPSYHERGIAVLALEWHLDGVPKPGRGMSDLAYLRYHKVLVDTVTDLRRAAHWLAHHPEVSPDRIVCVAVSLGAFVAPAAAATSPHIDGLLIAHGAGSFRRLAERNVTVSPPWLKRLFVRGATFLLAPLEPMRYIGALSPRPLLMMASETDRTIPREAVEEVFEAAGPPKEILWYRTEHVHPTRNDVVERLATDALDWLERVFPGKARS